MTGEGQLLDKKSLRAVPEKARCIRRDCAAAHAIADLDLAQDASYPPSLSHSTSHLPAETGFTE